MYAEHGRARLVADRDAGVHERALAHRDPAAAVALHLVTRAEPAAEHADDLAGGHVLARHPYLRHSLKGRARRRCRGGRLPSATGPLASSTSRWAGSGTGAGPRLAARTNPGSRAKQSNPPSSGPSQRSASRPGAPRPRAGWSRRSRSAERYRFTVECSSASWDSTLYRPQSAGWGSHGSGGLEPWPVRLKPKPVPAADQGRGTRQPSRPGYSPWVRKNRGSWRAPSPISVTSGRPSSSPW